MTATIALYVFAVLAVLYWIPIRLWYRRWGVTDSELTGPMLGDDQVPSPNYEAMLAVMIDARPEFVWPWLVQLGKGRGGLYSYDWLDRLFGYLDGPSATSILPEFQRLEAGDVIPIGGASGGFPVTAVDPYHTLVMSGQAGPSRWVWELHLQAADKHRTRLISRNRASFPRSIGMRMFLLVLEPAAFIMTRRMLLGIKQRAEGLARSPVAVPTLLLPHHRV
ncbi:MAG TPA: hypothetical protein VM818_05115 [Vicinamibacterales bacterium]|jgi:hypothetical protein|nr:hypothetical protein [Vicinamibacterales bacterium]